MNHRGGHDTPRPFGPKPRDNSAFTRPPARMADLPSLSSLLHNAATYTAIAVFLATYLFIADGRVKGNADHEPFAAHIRHVGQGFELFHQICSHFGRVLRQVMVKHFRYGGQRGGATDGIPAIGCAVATYR